MGGLILLQQQQIVTNIFPLTKPGKMHKIDCQNLGAELASVTTEGENDFLTTLTQERAFVGAYKDDTDTWQWSDGSTWDYTNWSTGQPDDAQGMQGYAVINYKDDGSWDDEWYTATYPFICEK